MEGWPQSLISKDLSAESGFDFEAASFFFTILVLKVPGFFADSARRSPVNREYFE
jgi:hypothetical protein